MIPDRTELTRKYECEYYTVRAHPRSCFFCQNCTDIFFDSEGPYWWFCRENMLQDEGMTGKCTLFLEDYEE